MIISTFRGSFLKSYNCGFLTQFLLIWRYFVQVTQYKVRLYICRIRTKIIWYYAIIESCILNLGWNSPLCRHYLNPRNISCSCVASEVCVWMARYSVPLSIYPGTLFVRRIINGTLKWKLYNDLILSCYLSCFWYDRPGPDDRAR